VFLQTPGTPSNPPKFLGGDFDGTDSNGNFEVQVPANTVFQVFVDSFSTPNVTFANPAVNTSSVSSFDSGASNLDFLQ
jgi:hypothetical protein